MMTLEEGRCKAAAAVLNLIEEPDHDMWENLESGVKSLVFVSVLSVVDNLPFTDDEWTNMRREFERQVPPAMRADIRVFFAIMQPSERLPPESFAHALQSEQGTVAITSICVNIIRAFSPSDDELRGLALGLTSGPITDEDREKWEIINR